LKNILYIKSQNITHIISENKLRGHVSQEKSILLKDSILTYDQGIKYLYSLLIMIVSFYDYHLETIQTSNSLLNEVISYLQLDKKITPKEDIKQAKENSRLLFDGIFSVNYYYFSCFHNVFRRYP